MEESIISDVKSDEEVVVQSEATSESIEDVAKDIFGTFEVNE